MNMTLQRVVGLDALAGAEHDALERRVDEVHRAPRSRPRAARSRPAQHAAATDEVDALLDQVLGELGRRLRRGRRCTESTIAVTGSSIASRTSSGERIDGLGQPAHELAAAHLGAHLVVGRRTPSRWTILISSAVRSPMAMPYSRRM